MPQISDAAASSHQTGFSELLADSVRKIELLHQNSSVAAESFMSGENEDVHTVALAIQQSELAFQLGLQVRNKIIGAYQEIMRMQL